jgi:hypothetical protein
MGALLLSSERQGIGCGSAQPSSIQPLYTAATIAPAFLAVFELIALQPDLDMIVKGLQVVQFWDCRTALALQDAVLAAVPAAMDVVDQDGRCYSGKFLWQPLLQMVLPVVQHVMDDTAAKAQSMQPDSSFVQQRVAVTALASLLTVKLCAHGEHMCITQAVAAL